jgi:hypothetical protein
VISSGPGTLYIACDLDIACDAAHHDVIIAWPDRPLGIKTRLKTMDMLAAQRLRTRVYHPPWASATSSSAATASTSSPSRSSSLDAKK